MSGKVPSFARFLLCLIILALPLAYLAPQTASRIDADDSTLYYASLAEAFAAAERLSLDDPDEITLLTDVILAEPILIDETKHIALVPGGAEESLWRQDHFLGRRM
ncbi:hypothetical protein FACS1894147_11830 [Spirochaetia bacterium]|nr:hypothetical protein FACS1894147_11830 [Spirochaetia bacterium]